jgi:hypothetical protein
MLEYGPILYNFFWFKLIIFVSYAISLMYTIIHSEQKWSGLQKGVRKCPPKFIDRTGSSLEAADSDKHSSLP